MKLTDWEIADIVEKKFGKGAAEGFLEAFDHYMNHDQCFKIGKKYIEDWGFGVVTAMEEHESGEQYVWTFREYPNVAV